jgi:hypothetical protein
MDTRCGFGRPEMSSLIAAIALLLELHERLIGVPAF